MVAMQRNDFRIMLLFTLLTQVVVIVLWQIDVGNLLYAPAIQLGVGFLLVFLYRQYRMRQGEVFSFGWFYLLVVLSGVMDVLLLWATVFGLR